MVPKALALVFALTFAPIGAHAASEFFLDEAYQPVITRPAVQFWTSSDATGNTAIHGLVQAVNGVPTSRLAKLRSDGSLDPLFRAAPYTLCEYYYGSSIALMDDGKVLTTGCDDTDFEFPYFVKRFGIDGTPDPTFVSRRDFDSTGGLLRGPEGKVFWNPGGLLLLQDNGSVDPSFAVQWGMTPNDIAGLPDGRLYVAGYVLLVDQTNYVPFNIVRLMPNGRYDSTFVARPTDTNFHSFMTSRAVVAISDGGALVSYNSDISSGGMVRGPLVRYRPDGTQDDSFAAEQDGGVWDIAGLPDGRFMIAGSFTQVNGTPRLRIARLHANGEVDTSFEPDAAANEEPVHVGGPYSTSLSSPWSPPQTLQTNSLPDPITQITVQADGKILARGSSDRGDWFMRFHDDGSLDRTYTPTAEIAGQVRHLLIQRDSRCVIWDWSLADAVRPLAVPDPSTPSVFAPAPSWQFINGQTRPALARINVDGTLDAAFATNFPPTQGAAIRGTVEAADASVLLWGRFSNVVGMTRTEMLRVDPDGQLDATLQIVTEPAGSVLGVLPQTDGGIVLWGSFSNVNTHPISGVARLLANGTVDQSFRPIASGTVAGVSENLGNLLLFGLFTTSNNSTTTRLARVTSTGQIAPGIQPSANGAVDGVLPAANGGSYLWGSFSQVNGTSRARIAKLTADGSLDATFDPGSGPLGNMSGLGELDDGKLVVWGSFSRFSGFRRSKMVRLLANGAVDLSAQALDPFVVGVRDVLPDRRGGAIVFLGTSIFAGSNHFHTAFYLRADGALVTYLPAMTIDEPQEQPYITQAAWDSQGRLVVAGRFAGVDGRQRFALARYLRAPRLENATHSAASGFRATVLGHAGQTFRLERSTNLLDWTPVAMFTATGLETGVEDTGLGVVGQFYRVVLVTP